MEAGVVTVPRIAKASLDEVMEAVFATGEEVEDEVSWNEGSWEQGQLGSMLCDEETFGMTRFLIQKSVVLPCPWFMEGDRRGVRSNGWGGGA